MRKSMNSSTSLRKRKKIETRKSIIREALRLFIKHGYTAVTLEQIADACLIHRQTILRYFKSKDQIVLAVRRENFDNFVTNLKKRPGTQSVLQYWRAFVEDYAHRLMNDGELLKSTLLIRSDPNLWAAYLMLQFEYERELARALSHEAGCDPETDMYSKLLAVTLVRGFYRAAQLTTDQQAMDNLDKVCLKTLDLIERLISTREQVAHEIDALQKALGSGNGHEGRDS